MLRRQPLQRRNLLAGLLKSGVRVNRATVASWAAFLAAGVAAGAVLHRWVPNQCMAPSEVEKSRLISVFRTKYKLPIAAEIGVADGGVVFGSCFRKLVFAALHGPLLRVELFASPDFRFLMRDVVDANPNPKELNKIKEETAAALGRGNLPIHGAKTAPVTIAIFSDFQCPYCARMAKELDVVGNSEGDKLRIIYHYFPLGIHPWAAQAAEAAACAERQNDAAFWSLHNFLFSHQKELSVDNMKQQVAKWAVAAPMLDRGQLEDCIVKSLTSGQIEQDMALGKELGVGGTPALFLNGDPIEASSSDELKALVDRAAGTKK